MYPKNHVTSTSFVAGKLSELLQEADHVVSKLDLWVRAGRQPDGGGGGARAADEPKYPNWKGQWIAIVTPGLEGRQYKFDPTKSRGLAQQAPLTPEYQKVLADSMAEQARGGIGNYPTARCLPGGMPRMAAAQAQEYIITPETTYAL